jgi:conjugative transfer signal peptidase TraF
MSPWRSTVRKWVVAYQPKVNRLILLACGGCCVAIAAAAALGVRRNVTNSAPLGYYLETHDATAPYVSFCLAGPLGRESYERGYRESGACPDGGVPMLKPVLGRPGEVVRTSAEGVYLNDKLLPNTAPHAKDRHGRSLPIFPFGTYRIGSDSVWTISTYTGYSFDSRYFGPVPAAQIRGRFRPLWTWDDPKVAAIRVPDSFQRR